MKNLLGLALEQALVDVLVEQIETRAVLKELERAFTHLDSAYYYNRKLQLSIREAELTAIIEKATKVQPVKVSKDAPDEQYLVTDYR